MVGKASLEKLVHFQCGQCQKWWSVGDAPADKTVWFCPWCGQKQTILVPKHEHEANEK